MIQMPEIRIAELHQSQISPCELAIYWNCDSSREKAEPTGALRIGQIFHDVIANCLTNGGLTKERALAMAESKLLSDFLYGKTDWQDKPSAHWLARLGAYMQIYFPFIVQLRGKVSNVEMPFALDFKGLIIAGTIDARLILEVKEIPAGIIDHKSASKVPAQSKWENSAQSFFYILAARILFGELMPITYCVCYHTENNAGVKPFTVYKSEEELNRFLLRLRELWCRLQAGIVNPRKGFWCSWCNYSEDCQELLGKDGAI